MVVASGTVARGLNGVGRGQPPGGARSAVRGPGPCSHPLLMANLVRFVARRGALSQLQMGTRSLINRCLISALC